MIPGETVGMYFGEAGETTVGIDAEHNVVVRFGDDCYALPVDAAEELAQQLIDNASACRSRLAAVALRALAKR